ncbi:hypothetical protein MF672_025370 [Actinomadura sp. ATCC 31491]|uniref:Peptidase M11 gametolysin domain-containing protein n=1 Tax=Actinomadura luzonensis TaxID=2805427 RepID=A0ABT0FXN5_9ACTN|nr:hypothetical protein [Actinomadura luzonensis]MCK2217097.1 hypothetical protein [Actinomadura luzonensis]
MHARVLLDAYGWRSGLAAHEFMHAHGVGHSFSNDFRYRNAEWSLPGEYDDPWDLMSAQNHYGPWTEKFQVGPVGFNGPHLDEVGWLPSSRVITAGKDGRTSLMVQLAPLERQDLPGTLLIRVPFDPADLNHYYTVEFRKKSGVSEAIPRDIALIHEVDKGRPYLLRNLADREPVQSVNANGVSITVNSVTAESATVTVTTTMPGKCLPGYVYRAATGTCVIGRTYRLAVPGDRVCVTQLTRVQVINDNKTAAERANPARLLQGPNTCKSGYVWRGADDGDQVCVAPATRDQTVADNNAAASRWTSGPYGPQTCVAGYVWREAFIGDKVCVTGAVKAQAREDNRTAGDRVDPPWD